MNISKINNKFVMNKDIKDVMNLLFEGLNNKSLAEGIDIDPDSKTISYNPSHENNVDTSLEYNPTIDKNIFPNVNVWSIFKRKKGMRGDGNPLVYALKGEREWQFKSIEDKNAIEKQFNLIAEKFATLYPIGVTVIIPSGNFKLQEGDRINFTAESSSLRSFLRELNLIKSPLKKIMIISTQFTFCLFFLSFIFISAIKFFILICVLFAFLEK